MINVQSFGAVGDGVADDTAAIQAALNAAGANGCVHFPAGVFFVSATLHGFPNQTLTGEGANTTLVKRTGDYGDTIVFGSSTASCGHVCISDMWLKHGSADYTPGVNSIPGVATRGAHVRLWGSQGSIIRNVWFWRLQFQVVYEGGAMGLLDCCHFYGIWDMQYPAMQEGVAQVMYRASTLGIPTSMKMRDCHLTGAAALARPTTFSPCTGAVSRSITDLVGSLYGVLISCCEDFQMTGCYSSGHSQNTILANCSTGPVLELRFNGNFFDCARQTIMEFSPVAGTNVAYVNVTGNTFNGENTGVRAISLSQAGSAIGVHSSSIVGNQFFAFIGTPILASGLYASVISANTIGAYNDLGVTPSDPSWCAAAYINGVSGNVALSNNTVGFGTYTHQGIVIATGLTNVKQYGNINAGAASFAPQTYP